MRMVAMFHTFQSTATIVIVAWSIVTHDQTLLRFAPISFCASVSQGMMYKLVVGIVLLMILVLI